MTKQIIITSDAELLSYHAKRTQQMPVMYFDNFTSKIVGEVTPESREAYYNDDQLQAYLNAKRTVWREISRLRVKGGN